MADRKTWSFEEDIIVCALYATLEYSELHRGNEKIKRVAEKLERTPDAIALRCTSYAGLDPFGQAKGRKGYDSSSQQMRAAMALFLRDWKDVMERAEKKVGPLREEKG